MLMVAERSTPADAETGHAVKVSVSLPQNLVEEVRSRVGPREFSAYVAEAVAHKLRMQMLGEIVDDHVARNGPIPEDAKRKVAEEWLAAFGE